ncbi:MAG TPA: MBL fold metallo-hydrolase [Patescibacteria group bacterium]|nr:MBL fold metallo-hydrolase [Patescibacteria group bacterium]
MKIHFYGAAKEVTGTCYLIESGSHKVLVDCGIFQGGNGDTQRNLLPFPFKPQELDAVFVTHPHMDHVGRVPQLVKRGYRGPIFATPPTVDLAQLLWKDMLNVMKDAKKRDKIEPMYDEHDVERATEKLEEVEYGKEAVICAGAVTAVFHDAGHVLGSSFIEFRIDGKTIVFSGDVGNDDVPLMRPTERLPAIDALVVESTYGDRLHEAPETRVESLRDAVKEIVAKKGVLMIPTFAIERTQEIILTLHHLAEQGEIPRVPVFLDSPLAIAATHVYEEYSRYFNADAEKEILSGHDLFHLPGFVATKTVDMSKMINDVVPPKVILAGAGMMTGGRILHHLVRYLPDGNSTLLIVGFQAAGTIGRRLYEGARTVRIHGQDVRVNARVKSVGAWSAHADQAKLLRWIGEAAAKPKVVLITHGEEHAAEALERKLRRDMRIDAYVPSPGQVFDLHA